MASTISQSGALTPTNTDHPPVHPVPIIHQDIQNQQQLFSEMESVQEINVPLSDCSSDHDISFDDQNSPVRDQDEMRDISPLKRTGTFTKQVRPRQAVIVPQE